MNVENILKQIDQEIARLQQARAAVVSLNGEVLKPKRGRPRNAATSTPRRKPKRTLSPEARARIAAAQKKRWAAAKKKAA